MKTKKYYKRTINSNWFKKQECDTRKYYALCFKNNPFNI